MVTCVSLDSKHNIMQVIRWNLNRKYDVDNVFFFFFFMIPTNGINDY